MSFKNIIHNTLFVIYLLDNKQKYLSILFSTWNLKRQYL